MNIEAIAKAIETDAGFELPELRDSLAEMHAGISGRTTTAEQLLILSVRKKLGLSQPAFAELIKTPVATLRDWEQGRFTPSGAVLCLLKIIYNHPDLAKELAV
jgi:putative transcriptional regulator